MGDVDRERPSPIRRTYEDPPSDGALGNPDRSMIGPSYWETPPKSDATDATDVTLGAVGGIDQTDTTDVTLGAGGGEWIVFGAHDPFSGARGTGPTRPVPEPDPKTTHGQSPWGGLEGGGAPPPWPPPTPRGGWGVRR